MKKLLSTTSEQVMLEHLRQHPKSVASPQSSQTPVSESLYVRSLTIQECQAHMPAALDDYPKWVWFGFFRGSRLIRVTNDPLSHCCMN